MEAKDFKRNFRKNPGSTRSASTMEPSTAPEYSYTAMELLHRYKTSGSTAVARRRAVRFQPVCLLTNTNRYASTRVMM